MITIYPFKIRKLILFLTFILFVTINAKQPFIVKLFYQKHYSFNCFSKNWGDSKGIDKYDDVCVVLNKNTEKLFKNNELHKLNPLTRNKFYVACTRARGNLHFISESSLL